MLGFVCIQGCIVKDWNVIFRVTRHLLVRTGFRNVFYGCFDFTSTTKRVSCVNRIRCVFEVLLNESSVAVRVLTFKFVVRFVACHVYQR